jgi:hypothetical protein
MADPVAPAPVGTLAEYVTAEYPHGCPHEVAQAFARLVSAGLGSTSVAAIHTVVGTPSAEKVHTFRDDLWDVVQFARHVFISSLLFLVIALPAIGLEIGIKSLKTEWLLGDDSDLIKALSGIKYTLLAFDVVLFFYRMANHGWKYVRSFKW